MAFFARLRFLVGAPDTRSRRARSRKPFMTSYVALSLALAQSLAFEHLTGLAAVRRAVPLTGRMLGVLLLVETGWFGPMVIARKIMRVGVVSRVV